MPSDYYNQNVAIVILRCVTAEDCRFNHGLLDLTAPNPNNSMLAVVESAASRLQLSRHEVHTRADLLHPQRVTSRWVGELRNT